MWIDIETNVTSVRYQSLDSSWLLRSASSLPSVDVAPPLARGGFSTLTSSGMVHCVLRSMRSHRSLAVIPLAWAVHWLLSMSGHLHDWCHGSSAVPALAKRLHLELTAEVIRTRDSRYAATNQSLVPVRMLQTRFADWEVMSRWWEHDEAIRLARQELCNCRKRSRTWGSWLGLGVEHTFVM